MSYFQVMIPASLKNLLCAAGILLIGLHPVQADTMEPSLGAIFPMTSEGESVITTQTILLNKQIVLPAGTILRCCFQMPERDSAVVKKKEKKNSLENTFSRKPIKVTNKDDTYDPYREAVKEQAFKTTWSNPDLFRGYFNKVDASRYYLVYQKANVPNPTFAQFFFPEGLFLASNGESIEVLSIQVDSRGAAAGFQVGDQIKSLEGMELNGDLKLFLTHYLSVLQKNKLSGKGLSFVVSEQENPTEIVREVKLPLSINSDPFGPIGE